MYPSIRENVKYSYCILPFTQAVNEQNETEIIIELTLAVQNKLPKNINKTERKMYSRPSSLSINCKQKLKDGKHII